MSFHEGPSDYELDMIEQRAAEEFARVDAELGEIDSDGEFDFCNGCPALNGHSPAEVADADEYDGMSLTGGAGFNGAVVSMELEFKDGTRSKDMVLATFPGDIFTGKMIAAARARAVKQTQECQKPKKFPPFLGPLAIKSCGALDKHKGIR